MFEKYDNQSPNYVPNNMIPTPKVILLGVEDNNFNEYRDEHNLLIGYEWNYGDTGVIPISVNIDIRVYPNDIISDVSGEEPDKIFTRAEKGDRFYNTVDIKSWCCNAIIKRNTYIMLEEEPEDFKYGFYNYFEKIEGDYVRLEKIMPWEQYRYYREATTYIWVPDDEGIVFFSDGVTPITLTPDMTGKNLSINILNFRHENVFTFTPNTGDYTLTITQEISNKLFPGIWYLNAYIESDDSKSKLLTYQLHVK